MVLVEVSLVNEPGSVERPTENLLALEMPATVKVLLNPVPAVPVVLFPLVTLIIST